MAVALRKYRLHFLTDIPLANKHPSVLLILQPNDLLPDIRLQGQSRELVQDSDDPELHSEHVDQPVPDIDLGLRVYPPETPPQRDTKAIVLQTVHAV